MPCRFTAAGFSTHHHGDNGKNNPAVGVQAVQLVFEKLVVSFMRSQ